MQNNQNVKKSDYFIVSEILMINPVTWFQIAQTLYYKFQHILFQTF